LGCHGCELAAGALARLPRLRLLSQTRATADSSHRSQSQYNIQHTKGYSGKKNERPCTSAEPHPKSTDPAAFFFSPTIFFYCIFRRFSASGVQKQPENRKNVENDVLQKNENEKNSISFFFRE
jgi:hypothetical protein